MHISRMGSAWVRPAACIARRYSDRTERPDLRQIKTYTATEGEWDVKFRGENRFYIPGSDDSFSRDHARLKSMFIAQDINNQLSTADERDTEIRGELNERISRLKQAEEALASLQQEQLGEIGKIRAEISAGAAVDQAELDRLAEAAKRVDQVRRDLLPFIQDSGSFEQQVVGKWEAVQKAISHTQGRLTNFENRLTKIEGGGP